MVSEDLPLDPSSVLHPFTITDLDILPSIQSLGERKSTSIDLVEDPTLTEDSETCNRRHLMNLLEVAKDTDYQQCRGLSLSLGSHLQSPTRVPSLRSWIGSVRWVPNLASEEVKETRFPGEECMRENFASFTSSSASGYQSCSTFHDLESFATITGCSRYLKPAQSLLEEVVGVGRGALGVSNELQGERHCNGFLTAKEQELQIRIVKLIALLDEVNSRYEHYYHQMEEVISSFEVIAGQGSARSYTCLALQAVSQQLSSLRDAILVQINVVKRELGQNVPEIQSNLSRIGMISKQNQAWRSIRVLPEMSVAILRSWLCEHFLHPYPKESEKLMLASQTGLTKNQVSNWFINARVRLWKPMIEEMYMEEFSESSTIDNLCNTEGC